MRWKIEVKPAAEKTYLKLDKKMRIRIKRALIALEAEKNPLIGPNVRALTGELQGDYRMRVGQWRVLFTPDKTRKIIYVFAVLPRGKAY